MIKLLIKWLALRPRIYLNLFLIALTAMCILGMSFYGLSSAKQELEQHARFTSRIMTDSQISDSIYQLHLEAMNFTYNGNLSAAEKVDFYYENIRKKLYNSDASITNTEDTIRSLDAYYRGFNQLRSLREKRRRSTTILLPELELQIEIALERLIDSLYQSRRNAALEASEALVMFMQSTGQGNNYFRKLEYSSLTNARKMQREAFQQLEDLGSGIQDKDILLQIDDIKNLLHHHKSTFNISVEETRGFLYLVNVILAAEANEILYQAEQRENQIAENINQQRLDIDQRLSGLVSWVLVISLLALIVQVIFSYFITVTITTPISTITRVFNELSEGSGKSNIPAYPQNDEIGDLTKAARTFKQKNVENRKVLNDYKELSEQLERRILERTQELNAMNKELEFSKEKAEEMVQIRSDFIANVSHEIRTPINAVLGMTYLMRHTELSEQQAEYLESINLSSKKLLAIINDILDFSKIEAGKLTIETTKLDLFQVVTDCVSMLQAQAHSKNIEIYTHFDSYVSRYYHGDPLRLGQVITNLLNNAVKFTEKGHVGITVEAINIQRLRIKIHDSGIGMNEEEQQRLFRAFSQADASTTRRFGGTGLGLVISKQIVEAMHGTISVHSEKGIGTTFTIELDMKRVKDEHDTKNLKGKRALLIEKDEFSRNAFNHSLQHIGLEVISYESYMREQISEIDVILYAVEKRERSALDAEMVTQLAVAYPKTPICLIYPMGKTPEASGPTRQNTYLQKPINPIRMEKVLSRMLNEEVKETKDGSLEELRHEMATRAGTKVIVADDNLFNRQVVSGLLQKAHFEVGEAIDGEDLIAKVAQAAELHVPYELVFVDYHMPKMNGLDACKALRNQYPNLSIVVLSGDTEDTTKQKFFSAGANSILAKPIEVKDFYEIVLSYIEPKHALQDIQSDDLSQYIPKLLTIDTKAGLRHSGGDSSLYLSLLKSFIQKYQDGAESFTELFNTEQHETLAIAMHSLKGIAASIGAKNLADSAQVMYESPDREHLEDVQHLLIQVLAELSSIQIEHAAEQQIVEFNEQEFNDNLVKLLSAVKRRRPKQINPILSYIKSVKLPPETNTIVEHMCDMIERFEYTDAVKILENLLND
ncbi:MAG TPA: ATP-binding protein [Pseudomonadales bacterium]|nr:ATP-binding protein [Pseudomonadales bacterium]